MSILGQWSMQHAEQLITFVQHGCSSSRKKRNPTWASALSRVMLISVTNILPASRMTKFPHRKVSCFSQWGTQLTHESQLFYLQVAKISTGILFSWGQWSMQQTQQLPPSFHRVVDLRRKGLSFSPSPAPDIFIRRRWLDRTHTYGHE